MLTAKLIAAVIFFGHPFDNAHAKPMQFFVRLGGGNGIARNHHRPGNSVAHSNVQIAAVLHQPTPNFAAPGIFYVLHRLQGIIQPVGQQRRQVVQRYVFRLQLHRNIAFKLNAGLLRLLCF